MEKIKVSFFGVGNSGDDCADFYFGISRFENIIPEIIAHYILINDINDTLSAKCDSRCLFISKPQLTFVEIKRKLPFPEFQGIRKFVYKYNLNFLMQPIQTLVYDTKLRFKIGTITKNRNEFIREGEDYVENFKNWDFLLEKFKKQTTRPIIFVYFPSIPDINGKINFIDPNITLKNGFSATCNKHGIAFIDMTPEFVNFFKKNNKFPRGFANSSICSGHLNEFGHKLIAQKIYDHFKNNIAKKHDVHKN